jgi:hypothetical protein
VEFVSREQSLAPKYFAVSGLIMSVMFLDSIATNWSRTTVTSQWAVIGVAVPLYLLAYAFIRSRPQVPKALDQLGQALGVALACSYVLCGIWLAVYGHRTYLFAIALFQALLIYAVLRRSKMAPLRSLPLLAAAFVSWVAGASITYTALSNLIFSGATSSNITAVMLLLAIGLALAQLLDIDIWKARRLAGTRLFVTVGVGLAFTELALRADGFLSDWVPYHRSYFTEPATFVRLGHWLLWDVPSQYGFLSILSIALTPGSTTWQSLYVLTAVLLVAQSLMLFSMLWRRNGGLLDCLYAALLPAAIFLTDQAYRWPYGPRVYPQHGVRFFWLYAVLFIIFKLSATDRMTTSHRVYLLIGSVAWLIGCFWSFESAVWVTFTWGTYLAVTSLLRALRSEAWLSRASAFAPMLALPSLAVAFVAAIDAYYAIRLGHLPDWRSYAEFSSIYLGSAPDPQTTDRLGPGWILLVLLGGVATPLLVAIGLRKFSALPALAAAWMAAWSSCIYFAGETFSDHVNAIMGIFAYSFAIVAFVSQRSALGSPPTLLARSTFLPIGTLLIAAWLGDGGSILRIRAPLFPHYSLDQTNGVRPISGELADIMTKAGIQAADKVVFPYFIGWTKFDSGFFMPFVRDSHGTMHEIYPWLPLSPGGGFGIYDTLPPDRQRIYVARYLEAANEAGWLITFHEQPVCEVYSPQTHGIGEWHTANYSATRCVFNDISSALPSSIRTR